MDREFFYWFISLTLLSKYLEIISQNSLKPINFWPWYKLIKVPSEITWRNIDNIHRIYNGVLPHLTLLWVATAPHPLPTKTKNPPRIHCRRLLYRLATMCIHLLIILFLLLHGGCYLYYCISSLSFHSLISILRNMF